jgi:hypothetical protein
MKKLVVYYEEKEIIGTETPDENLSNGQIVDLLYRAKISIQRCDAIIECNEQNVDVALYDAKTEAENVVLDDVSLLYDEALKLDNAKDLSILRKDVSDAIKARDAYFDAVQE